MIDRIILSYKDAFPTEQIQSRVSKVVFETSIGDFDFDKFTFPLWKIVFKDPDDAPKVDAYIQQHKDTEVGYKMRMNDFTTNQEESYMKLKKFFNLAR